MAKKTTVGRAGQSWFDTLPNRTKDILCIVALYIAVVGIFHEIVFEDMVFYDTADTAAALSWSEAGRHLEETENIEPQWFPYVFGGMPVFGSLAYGSRDINYIQTVFHVVARLLFLNVSLHWMLMHYLLAGIFMYALARVLSLSHLSSLLAALTLMLNPYAVALAGHGQGSKLMALSYIPLLLLLTYRLFTRRDILSFGLLTAAVGTILLTNHVQMAFYGFLVIGIYALYQLIREARKEPKSVLQATGLFVAALAIGFLISSFVYLSVREYAEYSVRGGGGDPGSTGGLSYEKATGWSFHPLEMLNYAIPSFFGFSSSTAVEIEGQEQNLPLYWGWMPFTTTTAYIGIFPLVFAALALLYRRNSMTVFLTLLSGIIFLMSFGNFFPLFYDLLFNYLPYFNKFRAPSMILHLIPFTLGLLAAYGVDALRERGEQEKPADLAGRAKHFVIALAVLGGLLAIGLVFKGGVHSFMADFMFNRAEDARQYDQQTVGFLKEQRFEVLWSDFIRSTLLACSILALVIVFLRKNITATTFSLGLVVVLLFDLSTMDQKFINARPQEVMEQHFAPDATMRFLQADTSLYRVFPLGALMGDNTFMYHLEQSLGGYSPAKLRIYQELMDSCFYNGPDPQFPMNMSVVNMLNTKYLIAQGRLPDDKFTLASLDEAKKVLTYRNPNMLPRAWFVGEAVVTRGKQETFRLLNSAGFDPRTTAILEKQPAVQPSGIDSTATATVTQFGAHNITLDVTCTKPSLLVVSEIYYPGGWKAFIDGDTETEIYKTNHVLRSVNVPAGNHQVTFIYDSPTYALGFTLSHAAWGLTMLIIVVGLVRLPVVRAKIGGKKEKATVEAEL